MEYDTVIVGARVAGASLALLLGQRGRRVLLVDRDRFPSDTLSTHFLQPSAVAALARLGVLPQVEASGLRRITRSRSYIEDCVLEGPYAGAPHAYALTPRRDRLDAILIAHARSQPSVEFCERTSVEGLVQEGERIAGVTLRTADGERRDVRARVVVGADGRHSQVARWVRAPRYHAVAAIRPIYYAYYHDVTPLPEPTAEFFFSEGLIGYLFPMEPGTDCLALEVQPHEFAAYRADAASCFDARFRTLPGMAVRMAHARRAGPVRGVRGIDNYFRTPYGPGWALTGDAGCCKDPSTGLGIGDAFTQAFLLAETLDATLAGADWETTLAEYQRKRDAALLPAYRITIAFTEMADVPADSLAWLRATLASTYYTRLLATAFARAVTAPDVLPPESLAGLAAHAEIWAGGGEQAAGGGSG